MSPGEIIAVAGAAAALLLRAFAAAAETALGAVGIKDAERQVEEGHPEAARLVRLGRNPERTLRALRAFQVLCVAVLVALATWLALRLVVPRLVPPRTGVAEWVASLAVALGAALAAGGAVYLLGDLLPRAWAAGAPGSVARRLSLFALAARAVAAPFVAVAQLLANALLRPLGRSTARLRALLPLEELERQLVAHAEAGGVAPETPELIRQVLEFGDTTAKEVMVPRTQVMALEIGAGSGEILATIAGKGHTRLPVYRGEIDRIVGLINAKDIIPLVERGEPIDLLKILRPASFVPWSKPIGELMREMQAKHSHMAMVVDEFGGFMGLITLEDILEEIVGEIEDEFDRPEARDVEALPDGSFLVRGSMNVEDFNRAFGAEVPDDEDYETVAGFLNALAGAIPTQGDTFFHQGLQLTVAKRNERRVRQVRVRRIRPLPAPARAE